MALPCELVDEIVTHLRCDERALRNCSLVARSWTYPSQKLLYARICITPETYKTWQEIASPTSAELFHHVLSLTFSRFQSLYALHEYHLKSFHRLRHLALHNIGDIESNTVDLFPAFQNILSSLSLHRVRLTLDTFIKLLGYFPNLKQLTLHDSAFDPERWATPLPPTHPRAKLTLSALSEEDTDALLWGLRQLEPEYDELNFFEVYGNSIHSIISTCYKSLKRLQLSRRVLFFIPTLVNLPQLRELMFPSSLFLPKEVSLISTITSTNIRKIVFDLLLPGNPKDQLWLSLDTKLSILVDRLRESGYEHILECGSR